MKASNNNKQPVTHGELCFTLVEKAPKGTVTSYKEYIAGHSETGHHHILESKTSFDVIMTEEERFVVIKDLTKLWHKKTHDIHETRVLKPGVYKITEKTEYNPFRKVIERVFD